MRNIGLLLLYIFITYHAIGGSKDYVFELVSSDAGVAFNAITTIVEDDYGFVWFGSDNGLYYNNTLETIKYNFDPEKNDSPPSNKIQKLYKDKNGLIWICTDNGVCYFNEKSNSFTRLDIKASDKNLNKMLVSSILQYSNNEYLIVINWRLYFFDISNPIIREIQIGDGNSDISYLGRNKNSEIYVGTDDGKVFINSAHISEFRLFYSSQSGAIQTICSANNQLWIGFSNSGIEVVNSSGKLEYSYREENYGETHIPSNNIRKIIQRQNGEIWVGTFGGIFIISSEGNLIIRDSPSSGLPHLGIFELYVNKNNGIWVGTWSGGLAYYNEYNYRFPHFKITNSNETISRSVISSFAENSNKTIWIGSENSRLHLFDPDKMIFIESDQDKTQSPVSRIKAITTDKYYRHWIATLFDGLWQMDKNGSRRVTNISGIISSILVTDNGVWIGTRSQGLIYYDKKNQTFKRFRKGDKKIGSISSNQIWDVFQDSKGNIWICSDFGLTVKYKNDKDFERYFYNESDNSISRNMLYTISEDKNGKLWIGTSGGGIDIYDPQSKSFTKFRLNNSIAQADVYSIVKDHQDNMWFSTNQGVYVYYTKTNTLKGFTKQDGLPGYQYLPNSGFISSSGKLFFGGGNGFNIIDPKVVKQNPIVPEAYLSKILINNSSIGEQNVKYVNSKFLAGIEEIELNYNQNSLTFGFVANNFIKTAKNRFRYRVKNYQNDWIEIDQGKDISFTKIPPGNYVLEVLASNNDGVWNKNPQKIDIIINPPFWLTWYAYLIYGVLITSILLIVLRELRFREKSRADEIIFSDKVKFFTNVSHEFRTPLTLIISPLNNLMKKFNSDPAIMDHFKIIKRNADRLLRLTNQILDFRLIELNKVKLNREDEDIVMLCKNVYDCFEYQIIEKDINCIFTSSFKSFHLSVDIEKIEKVIYNLLSNALKFSDEKGQVILSIEQKTLSENSYSNLFCTGNKFLGDSLEICVKDNGTGIKKDSLPNIFDRFFVDHGDDVPGTGIGLHICQEYIRLHKGNILVNSEKDNGSSFTINIPIENLADFDKENLIFQYHSDGTNRNEEGIKDTPEDLVKTNKVVLFAEDNDELRFYFKNLLSAKYKVLTAKNGKQAFEIAIEVVPDIIISDILMPGTDGLELTKMIKNNSKTNHIPLILLTALSDDKYKIDAMTKGANVFLTKPVDESLLFANIENIFNQRETLKKKYKDRESKNLLVPDVNKSFIQKAELIVENNLQNPAFEIAEFASALGISRSSLQRKMKTENNLTPTEFIRDFKLKKATELLKTGTYNVDEIATLAGFNSTSYFIRSFKKKYGKTPSAFKTMI